MLASVHKHTSGVISGAGGFSVGSVTFGCDVYFVEEVTCDNPGFSTHLFPCAQTNGSNCLLERQAVTAVCLSTPLLLSTGIIFLVIL